MGADNLMHNIETQPQSPARRTLTVCDLIEPLKEMGDRLAGDSLPPILHLQDGFLALLLQPNRNLLCPRGVGDGIGQEIEQHLLKPLGITLDDQWLGWSCEDQL